jgi:hypothetical protein
MSRIGVDEEARPNAFALEPLNGALDRAAAGGKIEATLGRELSATLGNEGHLVGTQARSDGEHFIGARHLEVEHRTDRRPDPLDISIVDVPPVLAEVGGDAIGAGFLARERDLHRVGFRGAARLPNRRDVIDVDVESLVGCSHFRPRLGSLAVSRESYVKKLLILMVFVVSCRPVAPSSTPSPQTPGASDARSALELFLAAVRAQDLQAMAIAWGSADGPARDIMPQDELFKREVVLQCYTDHDRSRLIGAARQMGDSVVFNVELTKGNMTRQSPFTTIKGPKSRWYMLTFDPVPLKDLCRNPPPPPRNQAPAPSISDLTAR